MKYESKNMKKKTHLKSACAAITLMISLVSAPPGLAATIRVPADYSTIQAAADAASSGDTVEIAPGVYVEQILIVGKSLTLAGKPGADETCVCMQLEAGLKSGARRRREGFLEARPGRSISSETTDLPRHFQSAKNK
jgi:pectin methylesterase-like acyl-CoA thioesterase